MLNQLEPRKRNEYDGLLAERRSLSDEADRLERELSSVTDARDKAKAEIDQDNTRARYHAISRQINELNAKKGKSSELLKNLQLSPDEQKRRARGCSPAGRFAPVLIAALQRACGKSARRPSLLAVTYKRG